MSADFGAREWGALAGLWHDLGKYSEDFQRYIRKSSGYEVHLVDSAPGKVNHASAGALHGMERLSNAALPLAYLIAGHHAGLPDWSPADGAGNAALENRLRKTSRKVFSKRPSRKHRMLFFISRRRRWPPSKQARSSRGCTYGYGCSSPV